MARSQSFRQYLAGKDTIFGVFAKTNDPFFIEILGKAGFDFVILDSEHGPNSPRELYPLIMAAVASGIYPVVRVGALCETDVQRALDLGIAGIQIPQIRTAEDARKVRELTRFHPKGKRGLCRYVRAADFSLQDRAEYLRNQNEVVTIVHVEGMEGVKNLDAIMAVEDIDVIFIGPYDLSQSLGIPGEVDHPTLTSEIENVIRRCKKRGKVVGIFADTVEKCKEFQQMGVKYIAYSVDVGIFAEACRNAASGLRGKACGR